MQTSIKNVAFAGSGNVAWHLALELKLKGYHISHVWSRDYTNAIELAKSCDSVACVDISNLREGSDLIIIAVTDDAIEDVARSIGKFDGIVVHTAGSVAMDILKHSFEHYGVLYPLQTFSKETPVNFANVPFFLESSSATVQKAIKKLALKLSPRVYDADSQKRMLLHIAAVFASNYSNLMYIVSNEILKDSRLPHEIMYPLIKETALKALKDDPLKMQTGPARRHDNITIEKHIAALASMPEYADLYRLLANLISKKYK